MTDTSFLTQISGQPVDQLTQLGPDRRAAAVRATIPDLHFFFDEGRAFEYRNLPPRTLALARSLLEALSAAPEGDGDAKSLRERIVTDAVLRGEADRDQNVYLGHLFTRRLTHAVPDLVFQPVDAAEAAGALRWARAEGVPVTLRGAASTAMGGSVPGDGGLTLDLSRLDAIDPEVQNEVCVVGAGARLRTVHRKLAEHGLALRVYPSNLGGTLAGWFVTGGIGLNAYGHGRALDSVRAADLLLPSGEHVRFHDDGRLDVPDSDGRRRTLVAEETADWFSAQGYRPLVLADLAGSEGVFGLLLQLTVVVEPRPEIAAFLLSFERRDQALDAVDWIARAAGSRFRSPTNLKLLSGSHLHNVRRVWRDEDARGWRERPGVLSSQGPLPWRGILGPRALGATISADSPQATAYLFVDFFDGAAGRAFASALADCPGAPRVLDAESVRFAVERFRPQQTKRLGPGLLAAEILLPAREVPRFLPRAERLARNVGLELDAEVYYLADGTALAIAGFLTDHRRGSFALDLVLAPALVDLAMSGHQGRPYVLGRWQSSWLARKVGAAEAKRLRGIKRAVDPHALLNRGVLFGLRLRGVLGALLGATFGIGVTLVRGVYGSPALAWLPRAARPVLARLRGPAHGRGEPLPVEGALPTPAGPAASARALHCVNCGECNSVCPIFVESKVRLPQMLTHLGEALHGGEALSETGGTLLDLCMRCGNCEEVCQAGIPHLPLYDAMQAAADAARPRRRERHIAILAAVRDSSRYLRDELGVRPGGYVKRAPASLPGVPRYLLLRAENDAGPAATCIHCGACVAVCPTGANHEFRGEDPRWITTEQERCIGCGTCVEICPANHLNGGQTLRVVEAPTADWFIALDDFDRGRTP